MMFIDTYVNYQEKCYLIDTKTKEVIGDSKFEFLKRGERG